MAIHSSILAWKIRRTEEPGRLQSWWWCSQSLNHVQLCDPMDCSPAGSSVHGISEARILEWVTISFSRGSSPPREHWQEDSFLLSHPGSPSISKRCLLKNTSLTTGIPSLGLHFLSGTDQSEGLVNFIYVLTSLFHLFLHLCNDGLNHTT